MADATAALGNTLHTPHSFFWVSNFMVLGNGEQKQLLCYHAAKLTQNMHMLPSISADCHSHLSVASTKWHLSTNWQ